MNSSTQQHLPIEDIKNDVVILKDGSAAMVLQTSAVNFDLLSENEQLAIISSFAGLLNSLSFMIQIVIRSKRLNIASYLKTIIRAYEKQNNPLLKNMIVNYKNFVETIIRENEVLDKQFYIAIPVSYLELGIINNIEKHFQKALTILIPRKDHLIKQLGRIGLKATLLNSEKLVSLFYDIYNEPALTSQPNLEQIASIPQSALPTTPQEQVPALPPQPAAAELPAPKAAPVIQVLPSYSQKVLHPATPFVVEELPDDYGVTI